MFDPNPNARVFAVAPGVDFPRALVDGLRARTMHLPPEGMARVHLVINTKRMSRRIRQLFDEGPACLLPRLSMVTDLGTSGDMTRLPAAVPPLRRRLELTQLISRLLDQEPDLAARASLYDLADSLATLLDEMQGEGVLPEAIRQLDVSDMSGHWARAQKFINIAEHFLGSDDEALDVQARQRRVVENLIEHWQATPPDHPIILAGSTGSRGTTLMLMEAIARLPQGALILPGYDFDQPDTVWTELDEALLSEDHPQYRFRKLMTALDLTPDQIEPWVSTQAPAPARNRLVSLSLRPAPVTDAWMSEGPQLTDLPQAMENVTLVEASSPRDEALAIALRLREAAETGQTAALITPDRMLTRQVSAALDRWDILPDDSAGLPLQLSPPGRFLRHVAGLFVDRLTGESLLTLLKHPLCHGGGDRGNHLRHTRDLELDLRRNGPPFPDDQSLTSFAERREVTPHWLSWITTQFCDQTMTGELPLSAWVDHLRTVAEAISLGSQPETDGPLWEKNAGQKALNVLNTLTDEAQHGGNMTARDFADLLGALLAGEEVRDRDAPHERIMIWGTLEARVQGADLMILGGLNEGSWPEAASPDPWLNRQMRDQAGLLLPERRIGLSAHDYQQAIAAPEVWLTRATRSDDSETVASRWLNRLTNLLQGLPDQQGPDVLQDMRKRGQTWLDWAEVLEDAPRIAPAKRPSPRPPIPARPRQLSVTEIKRLIRDPYAIYAKHVLRLKPLDPLVQAPDALLRGIVIHEILETFIRDSLEDPSILNRHDFLTRSKDLLETHVPWPTARKLWLARIERITDAFIASEIERRKDGGPIAFESKLSLALDPLDFKLVGRADRLDLNSRGALRIYDYKTGAPPTPAQQSKFDKQLLIEAAMAEEGGFEGMDPMPVAQAVFIGVGGTFKEVPAPLDKEPPAKVWADLRTLIEAYFEPDQGFTSRRMLHMDTDIGDYDQLSRFGEWDRTADPMPEDLT
ncbi:double-strand break repair protein AddB [Phaeobacter gallaeciensis]|uniref:Double-strand break repair protein AddB n=2 Tax=Roseobacteraceae TaxID=2854170 RepID=A0A366X173_9RHOB|nr:MULTISPECIES: double-strand break repair protein AddB [Roseobacteraceae]MBT3142263.1 double-strand break repair protein AddB [Falsiruegeria litorea]MBT8168392.1 double-strand break repair protein AddB [Falsiruegeria litorea]RBW54208.1 double-strand break repair protein AddB [Phaeobacter gallaeciensis]